MKSPGEYITHHLTDWCVGCGADHQPQGLVDFNAVTLDLLLVSLACALTIAVVARVLGSRLSMESPGRLQLAVEAAVEYITDQIREVFPRVNHFVGAMALLIFFWVLLMNMADLVPIDLPPTVAGLIGGAFGVEETYFRFVPTAALDTPFAMAIVVFVMTVTYQIRANGVGGYFKRFLVHPYGKYALPANIVTVLIEDLSKPISLALRLFGNLFAGELIFALLALLTFATLEPISAAVAIWAPLHFIGGVIWSLFHLLIIVLQAFIFAVLTIVYLGMAQQPEH
ncbi:F0F1 ATP synthase subunit A [Salinisphaera sp. USBA-960]|uniref:F0F1 ATP synthase subunit A n=1 Tax=Salinisphaera orenii TaxID=856731 RepID=UPI000DBE9D12|nr:F0F1 ATP synthase subunit A [Salifodinibacter halophilus]NNC27195.1 F0F1 ATP synthase subunit A [Salifodinibacter halophilus]